MNKGTHTLFLGGEYLVVTQSDYFKKKYSGALLFVLEGPVEEVLGRDWQSNHRLTTSNLYNRLADEGKSFDEITEPVLYGKIKEEGSVFLLAELVLLSEIAFAKSISEYLELKKYKKIVELKIKN